MAHFAKLNENNQVMEVIVVNNDVIADENGNENEELGVSFCKQLFGEDTKWVQASYNGNIRKRYPAFGDTYDEILDAFITPKPYPSWILNSSSCDWEAPIPKPEVSHDQIALWSEGGQEWFIKQKSELFNFTTP